MNARDFEELLETIILTMGDDDYGFHELIDARVSTYSEAGMLTRDKGLVVKFPSGAEFQVTVVQTGVNDE